MTTTDTQTESARRVEEAFGHEPGCHTEGCPGPGRCVTADRENFLGTPADVAGCGVTVCTCITAAIQKVVRDERALVLELAGEAIFGFSTKPQRGLRHLRRFAGLVRNGEA